jgi:predicted nucleotidyltransferase
MQKQSLVAFSLELAKTSSKDVRFVIIDGSTAEGSDRRYSDYDVVVVRKGLFEQPGMIKDLFGVYEGRIISGWLVDDQSFRKRYLGDDDHEFLWRKRQLRKARLLYGNNSEFRRIIQQALARRWNRKRQMAVIKPSYVTMVEYMGKMLNKTMTRQAGSHEFYQDGYIIAMNAALIVAALNRIDLDSDKSMYRQVIAEAKVKPASFVREFGIVSGLTSAGRNSATVVSASRRLLRWARRQILSQVLEEGDDSEFASVVREIKF